MNRTICLMLILGTGLIWGCKNAQQEQIGPDDVLEMLDKWKQTMTSRDVALMESILHEDFKYAGNADGTLTDKRAMMSYYESEGGTALSADFSDIDIEYFGDIAIVRAREVMRFPGSQGDTVEILLRFTDVYLKQNGHVSTISTHSSPISPE